MTGEPGWDDFGFNPTDFELTRVWLDGWRPPPLSQFPEVRIEPRLDVAQGGRWYSELATPASAEYWAVYGVEPDGAVDWSADFPTLEEAVVFAQGWDRPIQMPDLRPAAPVGDPHTAPTTAPTPQGWMVADLIDAVARWEQAGADFAAASQARDEAFRVAQRNGHTIGQIAAAADTDPTLVVAAIGRANGSADPGLTGLHAQAVGQAQASKALASALAGPTITPATPIVPGRPGMNLSTRATGIHR